MGVWVIEKKVSDIIIYHCNKMIMFKSKSAELGNVDAIANLAS